MENLATFENPVFGIKHALKTSRRVEQREKRKREKRSKDRTRSYATEGNFGKSRQI